MTLGMLVHLQPTSMAPTIDLAGWECSTAMQAMCAALPWVVTPASNQAGLPMRLL